MEDLRKKTTARAGFTLVELVVVIAILGILAGVAYPAYTGYIKRAQEAKVQSQLSTVVVTIDSAMAIAGDSGTLGQIDIKMTYSDTDGTSTGTLTAYYVDSDGKAGDASKQITLDSSTIKQLGGTNSVFSKTADTGNTITVTLKDLKDTSYSKDGTFTWKVGEQKWTFA